ncbi:MAG: PQQ-dependent sugar dehydrogenase [Planctomycetaceae bacterium]
MRLMLAHRGHAPVRIVAALTIAGLVLTGPAATGRTAGDRAARAPALKAVPVATGLADPAGFTFGPKGLIWYLEKNTGEVRVLNVTTGADRLFTTITHVNGAGERGALGIAFHPRYPKKPFLYVYATRTLSGRVWNELLRIRVDAGKPAGMRVLLRSPVDASTNHNGGRIAFGPDGKLYVVIGDGGSEYPKDPAHAQNLKELRGKILRIDPDGSIPADNPFGTRVWSYGHRNSFGFDFDPRTGRLWESENGPACNDEVNNVVKGGNYAWGPHQSCGSLPAPKDTNRDGPSPRRMPKHWFVHTLGVTGLAFCDACGLGLNGRALMGDVNTGSIRVLTLTGDRRGVASVRLGLAAGTPVYSIETDARGRIYFSGPTGIWRLARA